MMATLSLISGQKPSKKKALRKSQCQGCRSALKANDDYFAVPDRYVRGHYTPPPKKYCNKCFEKILKKTQADLDKCKNL